MTQSPFFSFVRPLAVVAFGGNALLRPGDPATTAAQPAWAEQQPDAWWQATIRATRAALAAADGRAHQRPPMGAGGSAIR